MKRLILMLALMFAPVAAPELGVAQTQQVMTEDALENCRQATVRIRNRGSVGSGAFFLKRDGNYYVLTNNHVAGRTGNVVSVEMWYRGYLSQPVQGRVVWSVNVRNYYRDIAVIEIPESSLMGYEPSVVPIAPSDYAPDYARIYSFGCGAGSWLTNWEGHAFNRENQSGDVINFHPQPAGGRSGSSIFSYDGKYIIALIAWRSAGGQHNLDGGSDNKRYHGIAMTKDEVRAAFKGERASYTVPVTKYPLELPEYVRVNQSVPEGVPSVFHEGRYADTRRAEHHGADFVNGNATLTYKGQLPRLVPMTEPTDPGGVDRVKAPPQWERPFGDGRPPQQWQPQERWQPQPYPYQQQQPPQQRELFDLPENMQERFQERREQFQERLPQKEEEPEEFDDEPEETPEEEKPQEAPKQNEPQDEPQEASSEWLWGVLDIVLLAAVITGVFCWFRKPVVALITSGAVWLGSEDVRRKLDKKDSK